ncbi:MAG: PDZ domain-containing protein [Deltaproteobacteria bacterium]|nr:PDZ domain-containing protein [Deltaproteobacteria bacterium]
MGKKCSEITRNLVTYNQEGFPIKILYAELLYGAPRANANGSYGKLYDRSDMGRVTSEKDIDSTGAAMILKNGVAAIQYLYDKQGYELEERYLGQDGKPIIITEKGYSIKRSVYDVYGNKTEVIYLDANADPVFYKVDGYAKITYAYDEGGNRTEEAYFGVDGKSVLVKDGYAKWASQYDERGNEIKRYYFGVNNEVIFQKNFNKSIVGIGVELTQEEQLIKVVRIIPGGPADRDKRLQPVDKIVAVGQDNQDPVNVLGLALTDVAKLIIGEKGTKVRIFVLPAAYPLEVKAIAIDLIRDKVKID